MKITKDVKKSIEEDLTQLEILLIKMEKRTEGLKKFIEETRDALYS